MKKKFGLNKEYIGLLHKKVRHYKIFFIIMLVIGIILNNAALLMGNSNGFNTVVLTLALFSFFLSFVCFLLFRCYSDEIFFLMEKHPELFVNGKCAYCELNKG